MKVLPHKNVFTRLAQSKIHGIGVIAVKNIKKGTNIFFEDEDSTMVWVEKKKLNNIAPELKKLYKDFCVVVKKKDKLFYGCPQNFNLMTVAWYLNHSDNPNVLCDKNYVFHALRNIKKGEELTVDYNSYSLE